MRVRLIGGVVSVTVALLMTSGGVAQASAPWKVLASPNVGQLSNGLAAVSAFSRTDAWTVGTSQTSGADFRTLAEHWDGTAWSVVSTPDGGILDRLNGVVQLAPNDAWAVGVDYNLSAQAYQTLVEHWDGSAWTIVPSPNGGTRYDALQAVAAVGPSDVWAVGVTQTSGQTIRNLTLTEHWDGTSWSIVPSPNRPGESDAWLLGISAASANDLWAVGFDHTGALAERWDGASWSIVTTPNPSGAFGELASVGAIGSSDVWAVGNSRIAGAQSRTLTEHWDGKTWTIVASPSNGRLNNFLAGVSVLAANDVWAVGTFVKQLIPQGSANRTLTEHWNGQRWSIVASPNPGQDDVLLGSAVAGPTAVLAVGGFTDPSTQRTLVLVNPRA